MSSQHADDQDWAGKTVFSTGEAAQICNVSQQTIIRCFDSGKLQGFRVPGSKFRRIPREELVRFMRENNIPMGAIDGASRRVLCIYQTPSPLADLFEGLSGRIRVDVQHATNAFDAGVFTERFRPNVIFHDDRMDSVPLELVCRRVRETANGERPRIVSLASAASEIDRARLRAAGADEVIETPRKSPELLRAMLSIVERSSKGGRDA